MNQPRIVAVDGTENDSKEFATQVFVNGLGAILIEGRHAHRFSSAVSGKQPIIRFDTDEQTFMVPLGLVMAVIEGPKPALEEAAVGAEGAGDVVESP